MTKRPTVVISQGRGRPSSRRQVEQDLTGVLDDWPGVDVVAVPHLVDLAPDGPGMRHLRSIAGDMIVLSRLYPRAAFWLLAANGIDARMGPAPAPPESQETPRDTPVPASRIADRTIWCLDLRDHDRVEPILEEIERIATQSTGEPAVALSGAQTPAGQVTRLEEETAYRWYPVIDYSRCANCLECLNFCLFGVFNLDGLGQLIVEQPDACRNGCPACSRVCPSHAIIFPQHNSPAIAGDPEASDDGFNLDLVQLLGSTNAAELATRERARALEAEAKATGTEPETAARTDDLDQLVDDLDAMDL
jgi:NAD-dependent dihydropyrimidine dehydrogenase PreA subunit